MDKLLALKMFVATVDANGFSAAARSLGVATSSVTRMVDSLEADLETVLLNRSTRQVSVSDAGMAYYVKARKILEYVDEADASIMDFTDEPSGPLRISVPAAFGRRMIATHLDSFMSRFPKLELDITLTDSIVDMFADRVDLSIRLGSPGDMDGVVCRVLGSFRRCVVASPDYLSKHGLPVNPEDLQQHSCLRFNYGASQQFWSFRDGETLTKVAVTGPFKSNNAEVLRDVALAGRGVALLPDWLVGEDVAAGQLTALFPAHDVNPDSASNAISALYLPNHRGSHRVNAFISFILEILSPDKQLDKLGASRLARTVA